MFEMFEKFWKAGVRSQVTNKKLFVWIFHGVRLNELWHLLPELAKTVWACEVHRMLRGHCSRGLPTFYLLVAQVWERRFTAEQPFLINKSWFVIQIWLAAPPEQTNNLRLPGIMGRSTTVKRLWFQVETFISKTSWRQRQRTFAQSKWFFFK